MIEARFGENFARVFAEARWPPARAPGVPESFTGKPDARWPPRSSRMSRWAV